MNEIGWVIDSMSGEVGKIEREVRNDFSNWENGVLY